MDFYSDLENLHPQTSLSDLYDDMIKNCTKKLEKLETTLDPEKVMRYEMLKMQLPETETKANYLEGRGIALYRKGEQSVDASAYHAAAFKDLLSAKAIRAGLKKPQTLNKEASSLLAALEAKQDDAGVAATAGDGVLSTAEPKVCEDGVRTAAPESAQMSCPAKPNRGAQQVSGAAAAAPPTANTALSAAAQTSAETAELAVDVQLREDVTIVTASPAVGVEVEAKDGTVRFRCGGEVWDVPVEGAVTSVKRRRGCLVVTVRKE